MQNSKATGYPSIDKPWKQYYTDESISIPNCGIYEHMLHYSGKRKGVALEYMGVQCTYPDLFSNIRKAELLLRNAGVRKGDIVPICLPNIPEVVYLFYAVNKIGAVANMLDPRSGPVALKDALNDGCSKILFALDLVAEKFNSILPETTIEKAISVSAIESLPFFAQCLARVRDKALRVEVSKSFLPWRQFIKSEKIVECDEIQIDGNADAVIAYTGGTTGAPKGVIATNKNINAVVEMELKTGFHEQEGERLLDIAPPWTYYGVCNSLNIPLCMGLCVVLNPKMGADDLGKTIMSVKPNHVITVPSSLYSVLALDEQRNDYHLNFLKTLIVGADKLDEVLETRVNDLLKKRGSDAVVTKGYGMTEVMAAAAYTMDKCNAVGSVGVPYPGNIIAAFKEEDGEIKECKIGEVGEIAICGPSIMRGYFGVAASETKDIKRIHADQTVWVHTGDLGYIGDDARIYIVGRLKRMFVKAGYKVFPGSIEECLMKHPNVLKAAVVALPSEDVGNKVAAVLVLQKDDGNRDKFLEEVKKMLGEILYEYELPDVYKIVSELPLTGMGKIDYQELERSLQIS